MSWLDLERDMFLQSASSPTYPSSLGIDKQKTQKRSIEEKRPVLNESSLVGVGEMICRTK
jgi:hypothetical protein